MDPEIDELKELVARQGKVIEETNHMIRGMRRSQRWSHVIRIVWWLVWIGAAGAAYYYYVQPYIDSILHAYQSAQHGVQEAHNFPQMIQDYFKHIFSQMFSGTSTPQ